MLEHQRSIMAVMGIDLWMPKTAVDTRAYSNSLYRDQVEPELDDERNTYLNAVQPNNIIAIEEVASVVDSAKTTVPIAKNNVDEKLEINAQSTAQTNAEARPALQVAAFELQALCLECCVIVVNVTEITAEQNILWRNIQSAIQGQYFELKWPFALSNLQDGRGAPIYVQGFLDAICVEKTILSLGELPYGNAESMITLASLEEMLQQPQLKAKLWQCMQSSNA